MLPKAFDMSRLAPRIIQHIVHIRASYQRPVLPSVTVMLAVPYCPALNTLGVAFKECDLVTSSLARLQAHSTLFPALTSY